MADQKIIESFNEIPNDGGQSANMLNAPVVKDTRVRVHLNKVNDQNNSALADNAVIDLSKFPKDTEFNVRKFGDKGFAVSARDSKNNAVFEFVYDKAESVKQVELIKDGVQRTVYLNQTQVVPFSDGLPLTVYSPNKLPIDQVQKVFEKAINSNGFKFYLEDPAIDKKKGTAIPNIAPATTTAYTSPVPHNGEKEKLSIG